MGNQSKISPIRNSIIPKRSKAFTPIAFQINNGYDTYINIKRVFNCLNETKND